MINIKLFDEAIKNNLFRKSSDAPEAINYTLACDYLSAIEAGNEYINFSQQLNLFKHNIYHKIKNPEFEKELISIMETE